ncbi:UNVERIFIED_CONTAM: hypothetical protein Sangu_2138800 [Sesamum angustifolium]|uniref:Uncharacterized protein n=1 Tax=Sesamum angustifolium TaxID=2727405 RepID=A0AAW2LFS2_9LAMI
MEGSATASPAAADEGPESWEVADVDASMRRLMLSSRKDSDVSCIIRGGETRGLRFGL